MNWMNRSTPCAVLGKGAANIRPADTHAKASKYAGHSLNPAMGVLSPVDVSGTCTKPLRGRTER
jgi:hypothetical protein